MKKVDFIFIVGCVFTVLLAFAAMAAPISLSTQGATNLMRPCSHKGITSQTVSVSGTTARTVSPVTVGTTVMVTCKLKAYVNFGTSSNSAVATGADVYLTNDTPYWFTIETSGDYLAFIKEAGESDAACKVSECR